MNNAVHNIEKSEFFPGSFEAYGSDALISISSRPIPGHEIAYLKTCQVLAGGERYTQVLYNDPISNGGSWIGSQRGFLADENLSEEEVIKKYNLKINNDPLEGRKSNPKRISDKQALLYIARGY